MLFSLNFRMLRSNQSKDEQSKNGPSTSEVSAKSLASKSTDRPTQSKVRKKTVGQKKKGPIKRIEAPSTAGDFRPKFQPAKKPPPKRNWDGFDNELEHLEGLIMNHRDHDSPLS